MNKFLTQVSNVFKDAGRQVSDREYLFTSIDKDRIVVTTSYGSHLVKVIKSPSKQFLEFRQLRDNSFKDSIKGNIKTSQAVLSSITSNLRNLTDNIAGTEKPRIDLIELASNIINKIYTCTENLPFNNAALPEGGLLVEYRTKKYFRRISIEFNNDGEHSIVVSREKNIEFSIDVFEHSIHNAIEKLIVKYID